MVRSDDADLADDFSQIDWREIAAHDFELKARWFRHELEQRLVPPQVHQSIRRWRWMEWRGGGGGAGVWCAG